MERRNTLILIFIILLVTIVSLVVVLTLAWQVAGDSVQSLANFFGEGPDLRSVDYVFEFPEN